MVINKGGEEILNNTYGFEIEFASHNNPVLNFTHVKVVTLWIRCFPRTGTGEKILEWHIETDSFGVLELVTDVLTFPTIQQAQLFRSLLAEALVYNFKMTQGTYFKLGQIHELLLKNINTLRLNPTYQTINDYYQIREIHSVFTPFVDIKNSINVNNIDNNISITNALTALQKHQCDWESFAQNTILTRSEKDWFFYYSTQVNMPMTLSGFYFYNLHKIDLFNRRWPLVQEYISHGGILPEERRNSPEWQKILHERKDTKFARWINTGFWLNVLMVTSASRASQNFTSGSKEHEIACILIFLTLSKIVTGAMGALSQSQQLFLQNLAWNLRTTSVMENDNSYEYRTLEYPIGSPILWGWLEYHSALKDLTGLWFKADLCSVLRRLGNAEYIDLLITATSDDKLMDCFSYYLSHFQNQLRGSRLFNEDKRTKLGIFFDIEDIRRGQLLEVMRRIKVQVHAMLLNIRGWVAQGPKAWLKAATQITQADRNLAASLAVATGPFVTLNVQASPIAALDVFGSAVAAARVETDNMIRTAHSIPHPLLMLPPQEQRQFLVYFNTRPWEGRIDTMFDIDQSFQGAPTFLIEHRNN